MIYSTTFTLHGIDFLVQADDSGITRLHFSPGKQELKSLKVISIHDSHFFNLYTQLDEYFSGQRKKFELPLSFKGSGFAADVYRSMKRIPYGRFKSYGELAAAAGSPKAYRAVGNICGANQVPIIIPCHRVLASGGKLGGYSGGLDIKRKLLELENISYKE